MKYKLFLGTLMLLLFACKGKDEPITGEPGITPSPLLDTLPNDFPVLSPSWLFANSLFYQPIPLNAETDPRATAMINRLIKETTEQGFFLDVKQESVPVYFSTKTTLRYDVLFSTGAAPKRRLLNVPIPDSVMEYKYIVILDTFQGCVYELKNAYRQGEYWYAEWGNALPLSSDGIYARGYSVRGSGFSLLQGLILPHELQQGEIKHALCFGYSTPRGGGPVAPATESKATSPDLNDLPLGALLQLNPQLNLDSLGLTPYEKIIAKALQKYGMYCSEISSGLRLYTVHPNSVRNNPYKGILPNNALISLKIPMHEFRVIKMPPQYFPQIQVENNACATFQ